MNLDFNLDAYYTLQERAIEQMLAAHGLPKDEVALRKAGYEMIFVQTQGELKKTVKLCKVVDSIEIELTIKR